MVPITYDDGVELLHSVFYDYWQAELPAIGLGYAPQIEWPKKEPLTPRKIEQHYVRFTHTSVSDNQETFGQCPRFKHVGIIIIELYFSKLTLVEKDDRKLASIARDSYRKNTDADVWFRNARIIPLPQEEEYYRSNVVVDYTFDTQETLTV